LQPYDSRIVRQGQGWDTSSAARTKVAHASELTKTPRITTVRRAQTRCRTSALRPQHRDDLGEVQRKRERLGIALSRFQKLDR
jgi:hypothetical protein